MSRSPTGNSNRPLPFGGRIGRYTLVGRIGKGGMGVVYKARDETLHRDVALKMVPIGEDLEPMTHSERVARFLREARAVAALRHPGIVELHDVGEHEGIPYAVLELVAGATLRDMTDAGARPPLAQKLRYLLEIANILDFAHARGFLHRDIKPENVMITPRGEVKLLDFGLTKRRQDLPPSGSFKTAEGHVVGTPGFMSPEQRVGAEVDARADQYGWGCLAWELLTGRSIDPVALRPPKIEPSADVPPEVSAIVDRTLALEPSGRFPTMGDVARALKPFVGAPAPTAPTSSTQKVVVPPPAPAANASALGIGAAMVLGAAALGGVFLFAFRGRAPVEPAPVASQAPSAVTAPPSAEAGASAAPPSSSVAPVAPAPSASCVCKDEAGQPLCPEASRVPSFCRCETKKKLLLCPQAWAGAACASESKAGSGFYFRADAPGAACMGYRRGLPGKTPGVLVACSSCAASPAVVAGVHGAPCAGLADTPDGGALGKGTLDCTSR
ncbi:MAG: protein kinase [Myxococcales bacterium]|jgi:serine/threonine-protein kinase|nr:protein kinase [Myxococcales bacterium]